MRVCLFGVGGGGSAKQTCSAFLFFPVKICDGITPHLLCPGVHLTLFFLMWPLNSRLGLDLLQNTSSATAQKGDLTPELVHTSAPGPARRPLHQGECTFTCGAFTHCKSLPIVLAKMCRNLHPPLPR